MTAAEFDNSVLAGMVNSIFKGEDSMGGLRDIDTLGGRTTLGLGFLGPDAMPGSPTTHEDVLRGNSPHSRAIPPDESPQGWTDLQEIFNSLPDPDRIPPNQTNGRHQHQQRNPRHSQNQSSPHANPHPHPHSGSPLLFAGITGSTARLSGGVNNSRGGGGGGFDTPSGGVGIAVVSPPHAHSRELVQTGSPSNANLSVWQHSTGSPRTPINGQQPPQGNNIAPQQQSHGQGGLQPQNGVGASASPSALQPPSTAVRMTQAQKNSQQRPGGKSKMTIRTGTHLHGVEDTVPPQSPATAPTAFAHAQVHGRGGQHHNRSMHTPQSHQPNMFAQNFPAGFQQSNRASGGTGNRSGGGGSSGGGAMAPNPIHLMIMQQQNPTHRTVQQLSSGSSPNHMTGRFTPSSQGGGAASPASGSPTEHSTFQAQNQMHGHFGRREPTSIPSPHGFSVVSTSNNSGYTTSQASLLHSPHSRGSLSGGTAGCATPPAAGMHRPNVEHWPPSRGPMDQQQRDGAAGGASWANNNNNAAGQQQGQINSAVNPNITQTSNIVAYPTTTTSSQLLNAHRMQAKGPEQVLAHVRAQNRYRQGHRGGQPQGGGATGGANRNDLMVDSASDGAENANSTPPSPQNQSNTAHVRGGASKPTHPTLVHEHWTGGEGAELTLSPSTVGSTSTPSSSPAVGSPTSLPHGLAMPMGGGNATGWLPPPSPNANGVKIVDGHGNQSEAFCNLSGASADVALRQLGDAMAVRGGASFVPPSSISHAAA